MDLGGHASFVWAAYLVVASTLALLGLWLIVDGWRQQRIVDGLEARGVRHRAVGAPMGKT
jgi:heme exporter protein D